MKNNANSRQITRLRKRAIGGDSRAQYQLAHLLASGRAASNARREAVKWLKAAIRSQHREAEYALGNWYIHGIGVQKNYSAARRCFYQAAHKGHVVAMYDLAVMFEKGEGIRKENFKQAAYWYQKAASRGDSDAKRELGRCFFYGIGVKKDLGTAKNWYYKAAKAGDPEAQYCLGIAYEDGWGSSKKNTKLALFWYRKAARQSFGPAREWLKRLNKNFKMQY